MSNWRIVWNEAQNATELLVQDRSIGESCFDSMIKKYGGDAMIFYQWALAYERIGEKQLALEKFKIAKNKFPMPRWQEKAQQGIDRIENEPFRYETDAINTPISGKSFNTALSVLSKIVAKYGEEIFSTENKQKFSGLLSDLFPQNNEFYSKLKNSAKCDFSQILLDATYKDEKEKEKAFRKAVETLASETDLEKNDAEQVARLVVTSLDWDLDL